MMNEIKQIHQAITPNETLFVVDSMTGQDAVNTAKTFNDILNFDGVILTKLDGDTRGGAALSIKSVVNKPIKFIGTGEKMDAIDVFHPERMADRILGMGDVVSLVEKAQDLYDEKQARILNKKIAKSQFGLDDFLDQITMIKNLYANEMHDHINRWHFPNSYFEWENSIYDLIYFSSKRPCEFRSHLIDFFNLSEFQFECEDNITNTNITLLPNPNNGHFSINNSSSSYHVLTGTLHILNSRGQVVYENNNKKTGIPQKGTVSLFYDASDLFQFPLENSFFSSSKSCFIFFYFM